MSYATTRRNAAIMTLLAACALIGACSGGHTKSEEEASDSAAVTGSADSLNVVFQLTGLMLVVPPEVSGGDGKTHVLLPRVNTHRARLGFGLRTNIPRLCTLYTKRICYVDLKDWDVGMVGAGGAPTDPRNTGIPRGVVNVTRGSGGDYKAIPGAVRSRVRSHVIFAAGRATDSCSLGRWNYTPVPRPNQRPIQETLDLVNVLNWTIRYPGNSFSLRFTLKSLPAVTFTVPLEGIDSSGTITLVLAHVEEKELKYLPPADSGSAAGSETTLNHIHDFYNLLRKSDGSEPTRDNRPVPVFVGATGRERCRVTITTPAEGILPFIQRGGIKTYGCVVGSGEG